jgi:hypothetical protein
MASPDPNFEISPLIWLLKLDPLRLAAGLIKGKMVADILLRAKEQRIAANVADKEYEAKKAEMQLCACKLCAWAEKVLALRNRLAKGREVRIVGPA